MKTTELIAAWRSKNLYEYFVWEHAAKHLRNLFNEICSVKLSRKRSFNYKGPEIIDGVMTIDEAFKAHQLNYDKERDRDKIDVFIYKVYELGFHVGKNFECEKQNSILDLCKMLAESEASLISENKKLKQQILALKKMNKK